MITGAGESEGQPEETPPADDAPRSIERRRALKSALALSASAAFGPRPASAGEIFPRQTALGAGVMTPPYGRPSIYESKIVRRDLTGKSPYPTRQAAASRTPLQDLHGVITPNGLHYERHHFGVPTIDPDSHRLIVHGDVDRPMIFSVADIMRFPATSRICFLECSGNTQNWGDPKPEFTVQDTHGLLSCAEWTGASLKQVLGEVGVKSAARWMLAEGADAGAMTRSIPIEKAFDDALLVYAQNGERLRPEQGYPLRLLLPGYEGNTNVKWLRRLKFGAEPWQTREETSTYSWVMPDGSTRQFNFVMEAKSVITSPSGGQKLRDHGFREISGLAWSGRGRIAKVDVSFDGGRTWTAAALQEPILPKCLTRFRAPWRWNGEAAVLTSRATEETGYVQPSRDELLTQRDKRSYYHYNGMQRWRVSEDGGISNAG
jgi:sulfane dehydrogenase subunit SoxC